MITIVEPREYITKLWGKQLVKENVDYRLMKYVLRIDRDDKTLLHNVVTGHLIVLDNEEVGVLDTLPGSYKTVMQSLVSEHFLVPLDFDEYKTVNQLRSIYQIRSTGDAINHYIILPTTFCNAHCFYCYESDYPRVHMTEETACKLIDYIDEHRKGKNVLLSWFGGEPLVGVERIDQITQGLKDKNIPFTSSMISNAYLFDEELIDRSINLWHLERIQITLDGTEEVYNRVKAYVNVKDNPFQRVLRNIDLFSKNKVLVTVRLNVDFYNKDNIRDLIDELGKRFANNQYVMVYLNMLFNDEGFEPVHHTYEEVIELFDIIADYKKQLKRLGIRCNDRKIPSLQFSQCMADNVHAVEIQPDGSFCRCEHENINDSYGNLDEGILDPKKLIKWKETIQKSDFCPECTFYPSCYLLRYCTDSGVPCTKDIRIRNMNFYKDILFKIYKEKLEEKNNETV